MALAMILCVISAHHLQEAACGHHRPFARSSLFAAAIAYGLYAVTHAFH